MFGQQQNSSPFGSPPPTGGFGANATPAFGSPAPAFGAPASTFGGGGGFGSPAPAPGGFGAPQPSSGFGGGSTFGQPTNTAPAFGAPAPAPFGAPAPSSGFGSSPFGGAPAAPQGGGLFGAPAPAPQGGLFGAPAPPPAGGGFGAPSTGGFGSAGGGFGSAAPSSGFGAQASTFGAPAPSTGLFGAPAPAPTFGSSSGFGAPTSTFGAPAPPPGGSIFGSPAAAPSPGLFGAPAPGSAGQQQQQQPGQGGGTKIAPFQPTNRQDGTSTITMQSISAMDAYQNKNFEELRFEDYSQGNRGIGTGAAGAPAGGGFGFGAAPAPAGGGLFGSSAPAPFGSPAPAPFGAPAPAPAFGSTGAFGSPAPAPFGAPAPSAFGAPAPSAFGAPAPSTGFGSSSFGKPASGGLFGAPAAAPGGGLFGNNPAPAPVGFGAPAPPPSGGLFGAPAPPPSGGLFGAPAPAPQGGLFGSSPAPAPFGSPAPAPFGGFGSAPAPSGGLFGTPAPAQGGFGAPAPSGGLFGSAPAPQGGLFGSSPGQSLFGAPSPAPGGGFFGSPAPAPQGGLFGAQQQAPAPAAPPVGSIIPPAANEVLAHQIQALENKRKEMQKLDVWRGSSAEDSSIVPASRSEYDSGVSNVLPSNSQYSPYRQSPRSTAKIRPRGFGAVMSPTPSSSASPPLKNIGTGGRPMMSPDAYAASSVKRLVIKPGSITPKPKMRLRLANSPANGNGNSTTHALPVTLNASSPLGQNGVAKESPKGTPASIPVYGRDTPTEGVSRDQVPTGKNGLQTPPVEDISPPPDPAMDYYQQVVGSPDGVPARTRSPGVSQPNQKKTPSYLPKLTKPGYAVSPSMEVLATRSEADLASLAGFTIRHEPYGMVEWEGAVDVRGADLDKSIVIGQSEISVYTQDEEEGCKPEVGSKLNRPARITFYNVFPKSGGRNADAKTKETFAKRIVKTTSKMESAELISYDKDSGVWKIRVLSF